MMNCDRWKSGTALLLTLGLLTGATAPLVRVAPASAQIAFPDVPAGYWAEGFIRELSARGVIAGFDDGTFRPEDPVTRAQFAAMINKAFNRPAIRTPVNFSDVPATYWGYGAIQKAYSTGFLAGYPDNVFRPNENIPRAQVLVSLANGLNYAAANPVDATLQIYSDAPDIPGYARPSVASATEKTLVVNYPDVKALNPNRVATRAEVAAFVYQALVSAGQAAAITSPYIVGQTQPNLSVKIPAGTPIPVRYDKAQKILLARNEAPIPLSLTVAQNIVAANGTVLIPAGSQVNGQLQTTQGGAQFAASELVLTNGQRLPIDASSDRITQTETIRKGASLSTILVGTVVGAGAGAGIAAVTGDREIQAWEVLAGAGAGALTTTVFGGDRVELIAVQPNTDLTLKLNSDLTIR